VDSFIYALLLVPALRELLPGSGMAPDGGGALGYYRACCLRRDGG